MKSQHQTVKTLLIDIELEMRELDLWQPQPPSREALASTEPFCVDTLQLSEWLQWVLVPKMNTLLMRELPLPGNCNIHAIAEESFKELEQDCDQLLALLKQLDQSLTIRH